MSFIKIDRKLKDWEWFNDGNTLKVWLYLLLCAQYQPKKFNGIEVGRGQIVTGRKKLSEQLNMSEQEIRTCLNRLKKSENITIKPTNKYSVITIVKWNEYQLQDAEPNQQANQQSTNNQPTTNHNTRNKEYKEINKKEIYKEKSGEFVEVFEHYIEHRKKLRKPMTDYAIELAIKKLNKMGDERKQIAIINQSIMKGWSGLLELEQQDKMPEYDMSKNKKLSEEQLNELLSLKKGTNE